jgi:drug/metabolite transporter (DMT)-like permease
MVFAVGLVAAVCLGLGWVLQQRVAAHAALSELLSFRLLFHLMHKPVWWLGILAMAGGSALGGWALQLGSVALVEPLLSANLLFAFIFAALLNRTRVKRWEILGALLLSASLGVFIAIGNPHSAPSPQPSFETAIMAVGCVAAAVAVLVTIAKRRTLPIESALIATGAGVMYGLQDASTRAGLVAFDHHGLTGMLTAVWPYVVVGSAAIGILLSQSAFRAARLDYSLPPTSAAEPVVGIALGVTVLGDQLSVTSLGIAVEVLCLVAMVAGVVLIGRSGSLAHSLALHLPHHHPNARAHRMQHETPR